MRLTDRVRIFGGTSISLLFASLAFGQDIRPATSACELKMKTVKVDVAGKHLNIPLGYFYIDGYVKHRKWPNPSDSRLPVESLTIDFMLPDVRGLSCEEMELASAEKPSFRYVSVIFGIARSETRDWYENVLKRISDGKMVEDGERGNYRRYREGNSIYYLNKDRNNFMITCRNYSNKVSCLVKDQYEGDHYLEYFADVVDIFGRQDSIIEEIRLRVNQFQRDALTER